MRKWGKYKPQKMSEGKRVFHLDSCIYLALARESLSHGLQSLLKDAVDGCSSKVTYFSFIKFIIIAVVSQYEIISSIQKRFSDWSIESRSSNLSKVNDNFDSPCTGTDKDYVHIERDAVIGRKLLCLHGLSEGVVLLREKPYITTHSFTCGCRQDNLLAEHIDMAMKVFEHRDVNRIKFNYFMSHFYSGSSPPGLHDIEHDSLDSASIFTTEDDDSLVWSFGKVCLLGMIATLYCLETSGDDISAELLRNKEWISGIHEKSFTLFSIVSRIPFNTHAITRVISSEREEITRNVSRTVVPVRVGYALFLHASCINHSCEPNAIVRYQSKSELKTTGDSLDDVVIEIITTSSVSRGDEISISYGPVAARHSLHLRRQLLREQYLFDCNCVACAREASAISRERESQRSQSRATSVVEKQKEICHGLILLQQQLVEANIVLTEIMSVKSDAHLLISLSRFEKSLLRPIQETWHSLQRTYFEEFWLQFTAFEHQSREDLQQRVGVFSRTKKPSHKSFIFSSSEAIPKQTIDALSQEFGGVSCLMFDILSHLKAEQHLTAEAIDHLLKSLNLMIFTGSFGPDSIELNREIFKLATLYFHQGDFPACLYHTLTAEKTLVKYLCKDDYDVKEISQMKYYCWKVLGLSG